jgi:23S rRNA-/tRNA-specific pseudouridylate synthase
MKVEKKPLIPIGEHPLDVWYESPSVLAVKKPQGIKVHPSEQTENGTLLNRLFQHNRWLAKMETSIDAGVLHVFEPHDYGLMLFNKSDDHHQQSGIWSMGRSFHDEQMTAALLDRVTHKAHIIPMNGESYRLKETYSK